MTMDTVSVRGEHLAEYAKSDFQLWSGLVGCEVHHSGFGEGVITDVDQSSGYL